MLYIPKPPRAILLILLMTISLFLMSACGGQLAKPGYATVSLIRPDGAMFLHYPDGKAEWKRLNSDNVQKDSFELAKNLNVPAKVVETRKGSTITFPCGDTFIYRDIPKN